MPPWAAGDRVALDDVAVGAVVPLPPLVRLLRGVLPQFLYKKMPPATMRGVDEVAGDPVVPQAVDGALVRRSTRLVRHHRDRKEPVHRVSRRTRCCGSCCARRRCPSAFEIDADATGVGDLGLRKGASVTKAFTNTPLRGCTAGCSRSRSRVRRLVLGTERKVLEPFRDAHVVEEAETMQFLTVMCSSDVWELAPKRMLRPWLPSTSVMWAQRGQTPRWTP